MNEDGDGSSDGSSEGYESVPPPVLRLFQIDSDPWRTPAEDAEDADGRRG